MNVIGFNIQHESILNQSKEKLIIVFDFKILFLSIIIKNIKYLCILIMCLLLIFFSHFNLVTIKLMYS